jgi:hypothetical protein
MGETFRYIMAGDALLSEGDVRERFFDLSFDAGVHNLMNGFENDLAPALVDYAGRPNAVHTFRLGRVKQRDVLPFHFLVNLHLHT